MHRFLLEPSNSHAHMPPWISLLIWQLQSHEDQGPQPIFFKALNHSTEKSEDLGFKAKMATQVPQSSERQSLLSSLTPPSD